MLYCMRGTYNRVVIFPQAMYMFRTKQALMITKEYKCETLIEYDACAVTSVGAIVDANDKFWVWCSYHHPL